MNSMNVREGRVVTKRSGEQKLVLYNKRGTPLVCPVHLISHYKDKGFTETPPKGCEAWKQLNPEAKRVGRPAAEKEN